MGSRFLLSTSSRISSARLVVVACRDMPLGVPPPRILRNSMRLLYNDNDRFKNARISRFSTSSVVSQIDLVNEHSLKKEKELPLISGFTNLQDKGMIEVKFSVPYLYPHVWLRDNCQCNDCFHPASKSRIMLFKDLRLDVHPLEIRNNSGSNLEIQWSDGHTSHYASEWLYERAFSERHKRERSSLYKLNRVFWGSNIAQNLPTVDFRELISDDKALLKWLQQLEIYGFVLIINAEAQFGQVRQLANRVAFVKKTHYGAEFTVKNKPEPSNVAYSSGPLQLHSDLPYYDYKPGVQLIHCVIQYQGTGGVSQISDATHVAMELKKIHPEMFKILSETNVEWVDEGVDEGQEFFKVLRRPIICLDADGNIERINYSQPQRDSFFHVDLEVIPKWYQAKKVFHEMLYDPQYCLQFKMKPGTIQSLDNLRVLHGRTGYEEGFGEREVEGCYMDWDEARSKRRVLQKKFGIYS